MVTPYVGMQDAKGFNCFIPMPFKKEVQISIENDSDVDVDMFFYQIDFTLGDRHDENTGFFHAQFRRENPCEIKKDYTIPRWGKRTWSLYWHSSWNSQFIL